jgi:hypothetical protein
MFRLLVVSGAAMGLAATAALAEMTDEYFLSIPIGYGDARGAALCVKAAGHANSGCALSTVADPMTGTAVSFTVLQSLGSLDEMRERFAGDFVPWPWSRKPDGTLLPEDFVQGLQVPVILNPCSVMKCAEGSECVWNPELPLDRAYCSASGTVLAPGKVPDWSELPFGRIIPAVPMTVLSAEGGGNAEADATERARRNESICGPLSPGRICMGTYILDDDGTYWQIP